MTNLAIEMLVRVMIIPLLIICVLNDILRSLINSRKPYHRRTYHSHANNQHTS